MTTQRVDKSWSSQGLDSYPTEAILGTLAHYGVTTDEAQFKGLTAEHYPSDIAEGWEKGWKGTGPFSVFPYAAAAELWRRWEPSRLSPDDFAVELGTLMEVLSQRLGGQEDAPMEAAFTRMQGVRERMPLNEQKEPLPAFLDEAFSTFEEESVELFDRLAESLATEGLVAEADRFAELEEFLLPPRKGVARALVRAAAGDKDSAVKDLVQLAESTEAPSVSRLMAVDGLVHLGAVPEALRLSRALMESAEKDGDLHLALDLTARLKHLLKVQGDRVALAQLAKDVARLEAKHDEAHPHHRQRHG